LSDFLAETRAGRAYLHVIDEVGYRWGVVSKRDKTLCVYSNSGGLMAKREQESFAALVKVDIIFYSLVLTVAGPRLQTCTLRPAKKRTRSTCHV
jgi:hypothetical protein